MKTIQTLLEKQRDKTIKFYNATPDYRTVTEFCDLVSTIQQELIQEFKKKVEGMKKTESSKAWEVNNRIFYSEGDKQSYNSALSNLSNWLEGETK